MVGIRKPFQGLLNIIRFNWHFYVLSVALIILIYLFTPALAGSICFLIALSVGCSLLVSWYIYDLSDLYTLNWLNDLQGENETIVNIHAGFDETSELLKEKYASDELTVFDFYDPSVHTEVSIKRARKRYPPFPGTKQITTTHVPLPDNYADKIFVIFSAHEIRAEKERIVFFSELERVLKPAGRIIVTEHLRDTSNFVAYNIGFFHFLSRPSWIRVFKSARLGVLKEIKITSFVTTFILEKNGDTP